MTHSYIFVQPAFADLCNVAVFMCYIIWVWSLCYKLYVYYTYSFAFTPAVENNDTLISLVAKVASEVKNMNMMKHLCCFHFYHKI